MRLLPLLFGLVSANLFDFIQHQFQGKQQQDVSFESQFLRSSCQEYVCPDTLTCVATPNDCPCPFPLLQMRCVLPNKRYVCISKPPGDKYDTENNWKVDAKDNKVRDCGWVLRAYKGEI